MENLYDILEVSEKASDEIIEKAYRVLAKKYHPDLQTSENRIDAEEKMKKINKAYEILSDKNKREVYDIELQKEREQVQTDKYTVKNINNENNDVNYKQYSDKKEYEENDTNEKYGDWRDLYSKLTKKEQKVLKNKIRKEAKSEYRKLYEDYFRSLGYKVKHHWTLKEVFAILMVICILIIIFTIMWFIPPTHRWMLELYNNNIVVKMLVNIVIGILNGIIKFFQSIFKINW